VHCSAQVFSAAVCGIQAVCDNAVRAIDNESPPSRRHQQLVFDVDDYSADRPDQVLQGTPATPEEVSLPVTTPRAQLRYLK
jgi:hypothetical protein